MERRVLGELKPVSARLASKGSRDSYTNVLRGNLDVLYFLPVTNSSRCLRVKSLFSFRGGKYDEKRASNEDQWARKERMVLLCMMSYQKCRQTHVTRECHGGCHGMKVRLKRQDKITLETKTMANLSLSAIAMQKRVIRTAHTYTVMYCDWMEMKILPFRLRDVRGFRSYGYSTAWARARHFQCTIGNLEGRGTRDRDHTILCRMTAFFSNNTQ